MKATVVTDAPVMLPNLAYKNFARTQEVIPAGTEVEGNIKVINGLRRGKPFDYKVFHIDRMNGATPDKPKIIYLKNIKPMQQTEVKLGADSARSATFIDLPSVSNLGWKPILGTAAGAGAGFYYAKKKGKHKPTWAIIGGVVGFIAGKYWQSKSKVVIKPSK